MARKPERPPALRGAPLWRSGVNATVQLYYGGTACGSGFLMLRLLLDTNRLRRYVVELVHSIRAMCAANTIPTVSGSYTYATQICDCSMTHSSACTASGTTWSTDCFGKGSSATECVAGPSNPPSPPATPPVPLRSPPSPPQVCIVPYEGVALAKTQSTYSDPVNEPCLYSQRARSNVCTLFAHLG
eukprot:7381579-Prymnesium_polylepis.1